MEKPYFKKKSDKPFECSSKGAIPKVPSPSKRPRLDPLMSRKVTPTKNGRSTHDLPDDLLHKISSVLVDSNKINGHHGPNCNGVFSKLNAKMLSHSDENVSFDDEKLMLMPEEVIFLSFGVGCLSIQNTCGDILDYKNLWRNISARNPDFPIQYAVYHYFRAKNWVPKCGKSYGAAYGMSYFHSWLKEIELSNVLYL